MFVFLIVYLFFLPLFLVPSSTMLINIDVCHKRLIMFASVTPPKIGQPQHRYTFITLNE